MKRWIQPALQGHHKGALHRQLGINPSKKIPKELLDTISKHGVGGKVVNPTHTGKHIIHITRLLDERVNFAERARHFKHRR